MSRPGLQIALTTLKPVVMVFVFALLWPGPALSDGVPQNLASMARSLFLGLEADLKQNTGDETRDAIRKRARSILKKTGIRNWSSKPARQGEAATEPAQTHEMAAGGNERVEFRWDRKNNKFSIRIKANETNTDAGDGFDLQLNGKVTAQRAGDDNTVLDVQPDGKAISVVTGEELKALMASILDKWRDQKGWIWEISASGNDAGDSDRARQLEKQIEELSRQIAGLKRERVHIWRNSNTDQIVIQDKLKRLDEPFEYAGKDHRDPAAKERFARLEKQLEQLREQSKPLPVETSDPVGMNKMLAKGSATRKLTIRVTDEDGYSWSYDTALLSGGRITARRTLRNKQDLTGIKYEDVVRQLIASWSPPEWIELEIRIEHQPTRVSLNGNRWRLHWTADADSLRVKRIHTPYSRDLVLERDGSFLVALRVVRREGDQYIPVGEQLRFYGESLFLEAKYKMQQEEISKTAIIEWKIDDGPEVGQTEIVVTRTGGDPLLYRSEAFYVMPPPIPESWKDPANRVDEYALPDIKL